LKLWIFDDIENDWFPITKQNCIDFLDKDEVLFEFENDNWINLIPKPWSKEWFLVDKKRIDYLNSIDLHTFENFWTTMWEWIIMWSKNSSTIKNLYSNIINNINQENSNNYILQLSEIFNIIIKKENYHIFDELVDNKFDIWNNFRDFIDNNRNYNILTTIIKRNILDKLQVWKDEKNKSSHKNIEIEDILQSVFIELENIKKGPLQMINPTKMI
jgi:hypothetical protein